MWGRDVLATVEAHVGVALVIGHDDDEVGRAVRSSGLKAPEEDDQEAEEWCGFHGMGGMG
jgi:hypothetical protein